MKSRAPRLSLQGWLLALLLPVLGLLIVAYAVSVYFRLYALIIDGFNQKLAVASSTTEAFIDPADHRHLVEPLPINDMTCSADGTIWTLDTSDHELLTVRPEDGMAVEAGIRVPPEIDDVLADREAGSLLLIDVDTGTFLHFSTKTRRITPAFTVEPPISAVGAVMSRGVLYVAGRDLRRVDLATGRAERLNSLSEAVRAFAYDPRRDVLWGLNQAGDDLLEFDPATGALRGRVALAHDKSMDGAEPSSLALTAIVFDRSRGELLGSNTSLVRIDPESGVFSNDGFLAGFGQEQGALYRSYAGPMQNIMARAHLTYLYTQIVWGSNHINYGLDGTIGPNHSPLLSADTVPPSEVDGMLRLMTEGTIYTTGIQPWQEWGLLKSAFTPIFDPHGRPEAMAGADVDISTISFQTRRALVITFAFGGAMLLLSGLLALSAARRLTVPLGVIKEAALHAAAGDYSRRVEVARPLELIELARKFNAISGALGREVGELRESTSVQHAIRQRALLAEALSLQPPLAPPPSPDSPWAWSALSAGGAGIPAGGAVRRGESVLAWVAEPAGDALATAARRAAVAVTADALLRRRGSDPSALGAALEPLFRTEVHAWALLSPEGWRVDARRSGLLFRRKADGACEEISSRSFSALIRPAAGETIVLAGPKAPLAALTLAGPGPDAGSLLRAWRQSAASEVSAAFAVIGAP